jgi:hypothetical protein
LIATLAKENNRLKLKPLLYTSLILLAPLAVQADSLTLVTGIPGNDNLSPVTGPSPLFSNGLLIDFPLSQFPYNPSGTPFNSSTYSSEGVTISSPDGLTVYPVIEQGPSPNELYDDGTNGTFDGAADTTISLANATTAIGVGISDSDFLNNNPVTITLQALGLGGTDLGSPFSVTIPENTVTAGNGYFVVEDSADDIYGLQIVAPTTNQSGLAIADIQVAPTPEPSSLAFLVVGMMAIVGFTRLRKKA